MPAAFHTPGSVLCPFSLNPSCLPPLNLPRTGLPRWILDSTPAAGRGQWDRPDREGSQAGTFQDKAPEKSGKAVIRLLDQPAQANPPPAINTFHLPVSPDRPLRAGSKAYAAKHATCCFRRVMAMLGKVTKNIFLSS